LLTLELRHGGSLSYISPAREAEPAAQAAVESSGESWLVAIGGRAGGVSPGLVFVLFQPNFN
jgi:hypothetical protein